MIAPVPLAEAAPELAAVLTPEQRTAVERAAFDFARALLKLAPDDLPAILKKHGVNRK